jgi:hypothetical protein
VTRSERALAVRRASRDTALALLVREVVGEAPADRRAVECGVVRGYLWALTDGGKSPVHVSRLLNRAAEAYAAVDRGVPTTSAARAAASDEEGTARERLRAALEELEDVLDAAQLPNGRWLPAPTRLVAVSKDHTLLVGGLPSSVLAESWRTSIEHRGPFRRLLDLRFGSELAVPSAPREWWIGAAPRDLRAWGLAVLNDAELQPYSSGDETETCRFSVYAPGDARPGEAQGFRWRDAGRNTKDAVYLARRERVFGQREYRVAELRAGRVMRSGPVEVGDGDVRRVMYALDLAAGNPTRARVRAAATATTFELASELPRRERRLFAALGRLSVPDGKYYPRKWAFRLTDVSEAEEALRGLGVELSGAGKETGRAH